MVQGYGAGQVEVALVEFVGTQQAGCHCRNVACINEAAFGGAHRQEYLPVLEDALDPVRVEVLHEPVGADDVVRQPRGFQVQLGLAQGRVGIGIGPHGRHQNDLLHAVGFGGIDHRFEHFVLVGMAGRGQQEQLADTLQCRVQTAMGQQVQVDLGGGVGDRTAGRFDDLVLLPHCNKRTSSVPTVPLAPMTSVRDMLHFLKEWLMGE